MAPGSRPQTVPTHPLWPTQACAPRAATAGIAENVTAWLPGDGFSLPGSARSLVRAPGSREKALGRPPTTGAGKSSSTTFHQESWASFLSQPRSCCTTAAGTVRTARSQVSSQQGNKSGQPSESSIVKGQLVVDKVSGRKGLARTVTRSHCKVDFDDVEEGSEGVSQITDLARLEIWTPAWETGEGVKCHATQSSWFTREELPNFGQRRPVLSSLISTLASPRSIEKKDSVAEEKKALLKQLAAPYGGSLLTAWKSGIDTRQKGAASFADLTRALRNVGFTGNYCRAWKVLVGNEREEMTLVDLEPAANLIQAYTSNITDKYACVEDLWERCLDKYGVGRSCSESFCFSCSEASLDAQQARRLWIFLTKSSGSLLYEDLEIFGLPQKKDLIQDPPKKFAKDIKKEKEIQLGKWTLMHFRDYLSRHYGNLIIAWRKGLDPDGDGRLQFNEFCAACRHVGFKGNLKRLWCSLDEDNSGYVSMDEIDPEGTDLVHTFRDRLLEHYSTLEEVWNYVLDPDKSGKCTLEEFKRCCKMIDLGSQDAKTLFRFFDVSGGGDISIDEIDWIGIPRRRGTIITAADKLRLKREKQQAQAEETINEFKNHLVRMYRNLVVAWRLAMDPDGDGRLQFSEFCIACRKVQFQGNLKALWRSLDEDGTGYVSLEELDPEAVGHLQDFTHLLSVFFSSIEEAWYSCLDRDGSQRCTIEDFQRACAELGYFRAPRKLFRYLDLGGQGDVTIDELDCLGLPHVSIEEGKRHARDSGESVRDEFRKHFKDKYKNNLVLAWRLCFCTGPPETHWEESHNSFSFCSNARKQNFEGNMHAFWVWLSNSMGMESSGVKLKNMDPQGHEIMRACKYFLESRFSNMENTWFTLLDKCPRADVNRKNFIEAMQLMGYEREPGYVFDALDINLRGRLYDTDFTFLTSEAGKEPAPIDIDEIDGWGTAFENRKTAPVDFTRAGASSPRNLTTSPMPGSPRNRFRNARTAPSPAPEPGAPSASGTRPQSGRPDALRQR